MIKSGNRMNNDRIKFAPRSMVVLFCSVFAVFCLLAMSIFMGNASCIQQIGPQTSNDQVSRAAQTSVQTAQTAQTPVQVLEDNAVPLAQYDENAAEAEDAGLNEEAAEADTSVPEAADDAATVDMMAAEEGVFMAGDLSGDHVLFIPYQDTAAVMMAGNAARTDRRAAKIYKLKKHGGEDMIDTTGISGAPTVWTFEQIAEDEAVYYIATQTGDEVRYLNIKGDDVTTGKKPQEILVEMNEEGYVRLTTLDGHTVGLREGNITEGFGGDVGGAEGEWFSLGVVSRMTIKYIYNQQMNDAGVATDLPKEETFTTSEMKPVVQAPAADHYTSQTGDTRSTWTFDHWLASNGQNYQPGDQIDLSRMNNGSTVVLMANWKLSGTEKVEAAAEAGENTLTYKGEGYTVIASYGADAKLPAGTELHVHEITPDEKAYQVHYDEALKALQEEKNDKQVTELQFARFFDITFSADGEEIEPAASVEVNISYDKAAPKVEETGDLHVVHFAEDEDGDVQTEVLNESDVDAAINKKDRMTETTFTAEDFSVYGVVYTVDFHYTVDGKTYDYSMSGGKKISLTDLVEVLGIVKDTPFETAQAFVDEVEDVQFSDESLVKVIHKDGTWILKSVAPFNTDETLTITLKNGDIVTVNVTDAQYIYSMNQLLTNAVLSMNGQNVTNNSGIEARDGDTFSLELTFAENDDWQFDDEGDEMIYQLPEGITLGENPFTGQFVIDLGLDGVVAGNTYTYDPATGQLKFRWNTRSPNFDALTDADNARFTIRVSGQFNFKAQEITFKDDYSFTIEKKDPHEAHITKNGSYDADTQTMNYKVKVVSDGETTNLKVKDTITGTALIYQKDVHVSSGSLPSGSQISNSNNGFVISIPHMSNGQVLEFSYSAKVDLSKIETSGNATIEETGNTVKLTHDNGGEEKQHFEREISYSDMKKSAAQVIDGAEGSNRKTVTWEIVTNSSAAGSIAGSTITDRIAYNSREYMSYSGRGITVKVYDSNGNLVETRTPSWNQLGVNSTTGDNKDTQWTYTVPQNDGKYKYVITYTTEIDTTKTPQGAVAMNYVEGKGGTDVGTAPVGPVGPVDPSGGGSQQQQLQVVKKAISVSNEEIVWNITINVPKEGLPKLTVRDTLPMTWAQIEGESYQYIDQVKKIEVVSGLLDGEGFEKSEEHSYPNIANPNNNPAAVVLEFYKNTSHTEENKGLRASDHDRTLTIRVTTINNPDWMAYAAESDNSYYAKHTNSVSANNSYSSDTAYPMVKQVFKTRNGTTKTGGANKTVTIDGVEYPVYQFQISIAGAYNGPVIVEDTFDTDLFELYNDEYTQTCFFGGSERSWPREKEGEITATPTSTGVTFRADVLPMNGDVPYGYYGIWYYLKPKNEAAIQRLKEAAMREDGGHAVYHNRASFGDSADSAEFTYDYKIVDKKALSGPDQDGVLEYQIELNKDKLELNHGDMMIMKDSYSSNLSVDFGSVQVTTDPPENKDLVTWDYRKNTGTFTIPDKTHVIIRYKARVFGEEGTQQTYTNTASMNGHIDVVEKSWHVTTSGEGGATNYRVRLFKFAEGRMDAGLNGVSFRLLNADKQPVRYLKGSKRGQEVTFTTRTVYLNNKGVIVTNADKIREYETKTEEELRNIDGGIIRHDGFTQIQLSQKNDGLALKKETTYYLQEIDPPEGFEKDYISYSFVISDNPDYSAPAGVYVYHNNDILSVRNYPETAKFRIAKTFAGNAQLSEEEMDRVRFTIKRLNESTGEYEEYASYTYGQTDEKGKRLFQDGVLTLDNVPAGKYIVEESNQVVDRDGIVLKTTYDVDKVDTTDHDIPGAVEITQDDITNQKGHTVSITNTYFTGHYDFTKVDHETGASLGGAHFTVMNAKTNESVGEDIVTSRGEDGEFTIQKGDGRDYQDNTLYYLWETEAPDGYVLPDEAQRDKYYFYFSSEPASGNARWTPSVSDGLPEGKTAIDLSTDFASEIVTNRTPAKELRVVKHWQDCMGNETAGEPIQFQLIRTETGASGGAGGADDTVNVYVRNENYQGNSNSGETDNTGKGIKVKPNSTVSFAIDQYNVSYGNYSSELGLEVFYWDTVSNPNYHHWEQLSQYTKANQLDIQVGTEDICILLKGNKAPADELEKCGIVLTGEPETTTSVLKPDPDHEGEYIVDASGEYTFTLEANNDERVFLDLPESNPSNRTRKYTYSVMETSTSEDYKLVSIEPATYDPEQGSGIGTIEITNQYKTNKKDVSITKTWASDKDKINLRPSAEEYVAMVHLYQGDTELTQYTPTVTDNGDNTYTVTFSDLPAYENDTVIEYSVKEDPVDKYAANVPQVSDGGVITNTLIKGSLKVTKIWKDNTDNNIAWDQPITIHLIRENSSTERYEYKVSAGIIIPTIEPAPVATIRQREGSYAYDIVFKGLDADGTYYVTEDTVEGYQVPEYGHLVAVADEGDAKIVANTDSEAGGAYNEQYIINIPENAVELPKSGGMGTTWIYLLGAMLFLGCGIVLVARRRMGRTS